MRLGFALVGVLLASSGAFGQTQTAADYCFTHPRGVVKISSGAKITCSQWYEQGSPLATPVVESDPQIIDCTASEKMPPEGYRSCKSFVGLLAAHDKDVLGRLNGDSLDARVCFVGGGDDFFILSLKVPLDDLWKRDKTGSLFVQSTFSASLARYTDGVSSNFYYFSPIVWHRIDNESPAWGHGAEVTGVLSGGALDVDSDEAKISGKFMNKNGGTTTYELSIRLTTNRFKETWNWNATGKGTNAHTGGDSETGTCFHYQNGLLRE